MQGKNNNGGRYNGDIRLREMMNHRNMPGNRKANVKRNNAFDDFLKSLTDWWNTTLSGIKKGSQSAAVRRSQTAAQEKERDSITIGGSAENTASAVRSGDMLSSKRSEIAGWLKQTKFRTKLFAGVDEVDVWKKIRQLNRMYDDALLAERARYEALLEHYREMLGESEYDDDYSDDEYFDDEPEYDADEETGDEEEYEYFDEDEYSDY